LGFLGLGVGLFVAKNQVSVLFKGNFYPLIFLGFSAGQEVLLDTGLRVSVGYKFGFSDFCGNFSEIFDLFLAS
jgi:hypothetical protein